MPNIPNREEKEKDDRYTELRQDCFCGRHFAISFEITTSYENIRRIKEELAYRVSECFRNGHDRINSVIPPKNITLDYFN